MLSSPVSVLAVVVGSLLASGNASPADLSLASTASPTVPGHCSTTVDDFAHTMASVKTHECYTYTSTVPSAGCPTYSCPSNPTDIICAEYILVNTVTVPCATDCCPTTSTVYEPSGTCLDCAGSYCSSRNTRWSTETTGCEGSQTATPTVHTIPVTTTA
ncbi:hypothetical protein F4780DRAFT_777403 [Xylariomycetidae sp. FL0641]|nr:hypothetical protein F4780DRAFT_777403 [Xylariomycetidae sp. FL0641]